MQVKGTQESETHTHTTHKVKVARRQPAATTKRPPLLQAAARAAMPKPAAELFRTGTTQENKYTYSYIIYTVKYFKY